MADGDLALYQHTTGAESVTGSISYLTYPTTTQEDSIYSMSGANTRVTCADAGHYLVLYTSAVSKALQLSPTRSQIRYEIRFNNTTSTGPGRETTYWRDANTASHGFASGGCILDLAADDDIGVRARRVDSAGSSGATFRNVHITSDMLAFLKLNDDWDYLRMRNSGAGTASTTSFADFADWDTSIEIDTAGWTHSTTVSAEEITFVTAGHKMIFVQLVGDNSSSTVRCQTEMRLVKDTAGNGTFLEVAGTRVTGYARGVDSIALSAMHWSGILEVAATDVLKVQYKHINTGAGTWVPNASQCAFTAVALPDTAAYFRVSEAGGGQAADVDGNLFWDTTDEEDTEYWDHDNTAGNRDDIESAQEQWALMFFSVFAEPNGSRSTGRIVNTFEVRENTTDVGYGRSGAYNRGSTEGCETSGASGGLLQLTATGANDQILRHDQRSNQTDTTLDFPADRMGFQGVTIGTLFPEYVGVDEALEVAEEVNVLGSVAVNELLEVVDEVKPEFVHPFVNEVLTVRENPAVSIAIALGVDEALEVVDESEAVTGFEIAVDEALEVVEDADAVTTRVPGGSWKGENALGGSELGATGLGSSEHGETASGGSEAGDGGWAGSEAGGDPHGR